MGRRLFTVEDSFAIEGRGLIPIPGILPEGNERFKVGDPIMLRRPDGTFLQWQIGGLEMIRATPPRQDVIVLLKGLAKEDVPVGTEVWSVDADEAFRAAST